MRKHLDARFAYEPVKLPYTIEHYYLPDFVDEAAKEIVEAKGHFDAADRRKMRAVRDQYPDYTITILFQNPHRKLNKKSKTTYAEWCVKNRIQWSQLPR